jgi:hypothetical protein
VLSEIVENRGNKGITVDHIADLYIFDPIGILFFTNDGVCRFFSEKLHLAEWSMQPAYNFSNGNLENMGQFYVMKYPISSDKRWNLTVLFGLLVYPGVLRVGPFSPGFFLSGSKELAVGMSISYVPLGIAWSY